MQEANAKVKELELKLAALKPHQPEQAESDTTVPSLQDLVKELYCVADKWDNFGVVLNVEPVLLRRIKSENTESNAACLREMLSVRLYNPPLPSWSDIADAIEVIGEEGIANSLRAKYCYRTQLKQDEHGYLFRQLSKYADHWRAIGANLQFTQSELNKIGNATYLFKQRSSSDLLSTMLSQWLQWAPGDARGSTNFATLEALIDALRKVNLDAVAHDLLSRSLLPPHSDISFNVQNVASTAY